jgi:hypothetical protein
VPEPGPPTPDAPAAEDDDRSWQAPTGFPWPPIVLIGVAVLVSAVVIGYQVTRPAPSGPKVLTDRAFVDQANRTCSAAIPALRPQDTSRDSVSTPAQIADQSAQAADGLAALAQQLRALPVAAEQEPFVEGWLDGWGTFVDTGRRYAQAVRSGDVEGANEVARSGDPAQRRADAFARGNGIKACLLQSAIRKPKGAGGGL